LAAGESLAGSATWNLNPSSDDWNTAANWTPETVPNGPSDVATFASSNQNAITLSADTEVAQVLFNPGASAYIFTAAPFRAIEIGSGGILNNSSVKQTFVANGGEEGSAAAITFLDTGSAGSNTLFTVAAARTANGSTGEIDFDDFSTAGRGFFSVEGGASDGTIGGQLHFLASSTGGSATIINKGGSNTGAGGGTTYFQDQSHADSSILVANGGRNGGAGGQIIFSDSSSGDAAHVHIRGNGQLLLSARSAGLTIASLAGTGVVSLGGVNLTVGANDRETIFSGVISNGDQRGGSLSKVGSGILTLSGASTYTGGTTISDGALKVTNRTGSATGMGTISVNGGSFGGSGIVSGNVLVGKNGLLAPGLDEYAPTTLTIRNSLSFDSGADYFYRVSPLAGNADKVIANGVAIRSGAIFTFGFVCCGGKLPLGTVFTVISNTSASPINGVFSNLLDGSIFHDTDNSYLVNYAGGDGNDLTFTVVQEP
jgi:autotransporter-associated beta strand protein